MAMQEIKDDFEGEKYKFEKIGQVLEGYFQGTNTVTINGKATKKHLFKSREGAIVGPLGSYDLSNKLGKAVVGAFTRVTFTESKKVPGKPMPLKVFKVQQDTEDMDASAPASSAPAPTHTSSSIKNQKVLT